MGPLEEYLFTFLETFFFILPNKKTHKKIKQKNHPVNGGPVPSLGHGARHLSDTIS